MRRDWWVVSTVITDCALVVMDSGTGAVGLVRDPTIEEWCKAYHAPSAPYQWTEPLRVTDVEGEQVGHA